jgi:methylmalonyl-CoA mutase, C-terminal domain
VTVVFGRTPRILLAEPGPDDEHDLGGKALAHALKDAGFEVIYTGMHQSVEMIVEAAFQEDVDAIGLSIMVPAQLPICRELMGLLRKKGADDIMVVVGGVIPRQDIPVLKELGVQAIFPGRTDIDAPAAFLRDQLLKRAESLADQANRGNL